MITLVLAQIKNIAIFGCVIKTTPSPVWTLLLMEETTLSRSGIFPNPTVTSGPFNKEMAAGIIGVRPNSSISDKCSGQRRHKKHHIINSHFHLPTCHEIQI